MNLQHAQLALLAALALLALCTCDPARPIDERGLDGADACYQGKLAYCLDELGLDEATCERKAAAWCGGDEERSDD